MRLIMLLVFSISLCFSSTLFALQANPVKVHGKTPKGVIVKKNKVMAKKGYYFEKVSATKAVSKMRTGGTGITGDF